MIGILKIIQIIVAVVLTFLVLIQSKNAGLSYGLKNSFGTYRSLRGIEKIVFAATIVCGVLLVINSLLIVLLA